MKITDIKKLDYSFLKMIGRNKWETTSPFIWYIDYENQNEYITIPQGFKTNLGSVPGFMKWLVDDDDWAVSYTVHDYLYSDNSIIQLKEGELSDTMSDRTHLGTRKID